MRTTRGKTGRGEQHVLSDVAGEHLMTTDGMWLTNTDAFRHGKLVRDVVAFDTLRDAARAAALLICSDVHVRAVSVWSD